MKPIYLRMKAFGAFLQEQIIDFRKLSHSPLFLIHGPTGAGKTTIFDAMCYALYGETTGMRKEIRSDFATANQTTELEFIFQIREQFYLLRRSLEPKKVKKEETTQIETANFIEKQALYIGTWDYKQDRFLATNNSPITKKTEIREKIIKILGFDESQFKQIIVLPQGNFQEFLRAKSEDKGKLLSQLFNAKVYGKITEKLKEYDHRQEKAIQELQKEIEISLKTYNLSNFEELEPKITELRKELQAIDNTLPELKKQYEEASKELNLAEALVKDFEELQKAANALKEHLSHEPTYQANIEKLALNQKAEPLKILLDEQKKLQEKIDQENNNLQINQSLIAYLETELEQSRNILKQNKESWENQIKENELKITKLQEIEPLLEKLEILKADFERISRERTTVEQKITQIEQKINEYKQIIQKNTIEIPKNQALSEKLSGWEKELENLKKQQPIHKELLQTRKEYQNLKEEIKKIESEVKKAFEIFEQKNQERIHTETVWLASQAILLAQNLKEGQPCLVCGSTYHPNKAVANNQPIVTNEQVEKARKELEKADKEYQQKEKLLQELGNKEKILLERGKTYNQQLGELANLKVEEFDNKIKQVTQELDNAQKAKTNLSILQKENQDLEQKINTLEKEKKQLLEKQKEIFEQFTEKKKEIEQTQAPTKGIANKQLLSDQITRCKKIQQQAQQELENTQKEIAEKSERIQNIKGKVAEIKRNLEGDKVKGITGLIESYEKNEEKIQKELKENGFLDLKSAMSAMLKPEQKANIETEIKNFENQKIILETNLQNTQKRTENKQIPDLEQIRTKLEHLNCILEEKHKHKTELNTQIQTLEKALAQITQLRTKKQKLQQENEGIKTMADLATGQNPLRQTFEAFVLAAFLKEVVKFANLRLKVLSQERYQLLVNEEVDDKRGKGGLDLEVWDKYTNTYRDVKNLSGGETFFTSLALALGLADVATAKIGGKKFDAIFIDEGFGTLDNETLGLAIQTLMSLEGEHRMVGIISHVSELKDCIPNRIEVIKQRNGSQIKMHLFSS
ncbi:MAG: SMC family ATPase [Microscillaceae bacterium]|nr:SMC family ATPase [Microscillaceae bacterium]MDW8460468.1 SMC family ATPase [Cytophagales bacterium]